MGRWELTGTWDGTTFTLTQPPETLVPDVVDREGLSCWTDEDVAPIANSIREALDAAGVVGGSANPWIADDRCVVEASAFVDSPEFRAAIEPYLAHIDLVSFDMATIG